MCTLIKNGNFMSFQEMKQKYDLSNLDHFRYLQIRDYFDKEIKHNVNLDNGLIRNIIGIYSSKKQNNIYNVLQCREERTQLYT